MSFGGNGGLSLADIAAVTRNNDGFGGDGGGWWALIIILALCGGFGEGGNGLFGNRGGSSSSTTAALDASLQRGFDTQTIISKLDGVNNGICNLGYDQLAQMNNINTNIMQTGFGISNAINQASVANMQQGNALTSQIQNCCCNLENLMAQANYNRATDTCAITTAIKDAAASIMQNCNANYRQLYDQQIQLQMQGKDAQIAQLTAALDKCDLRASQAQQTFDIVHQLQPVAQPAYLVPNPNGVYPYGWNNGGCCNNGYGVGYVM